jgi:predicted DCC family thiol-disulfide oxidoreductase YuxK
MSQGETEIIVFFDGVCNLCDFFVSWLISRDKTHQFRYASLQGETAKRVLPQQWVDQLPSMAVKTPGGLLSESSALFFILRRLPWLNRWPLIFSFLPVSWTDGLYQWVAQNRYRYFGKKETCRIPTENEKALFLP